MNVLFEERVFKDPVHQYVYVQAPLIWDLINTKEFQRLRRIRQMGTSYLTFHGAEHSRFSHSLGVYEITRRIISQFERNAYAGWSEEEKWLSLCAALLHDVGHGPFSHSIERVFGTHHEEWSCRMIMEDTGLNRVLRQFDAKFPEKVASVIDKSYGQSIAVSLVSSQLDADRMDYLLRDAYFTGVNYGTFDLERILRMMRPHQGQIVIKDSGMHAVEDYLMSRYQMYWQVYFHPVTRSAELLLEKIMTRAKVLYRTGYVFATLAKPMQQLLAGQLELQDYFYLDEALMQMHFMQWTLEEDAILTDLCGRFLHRRLFQYAAVGQVSEHEMDMLAGVLIQEGWDPEYYLAIDFHTDLTYDVYRPGESGEKLPILLLNEHEECHEISMKSDIVRSICGIRTGKHYLYYPGELQDNPDLKAIIRQLE